MDKEATKVFFVNSLDFMEGKIDRITFHQYGAFFIDQLTEVGFSLAEVIEWLLEWSDSKRKE